MQVIKNTGESKLLKRIEPDKGGYWKVLSENTEE